MVSAGWGGGGVVYGGVGECEVRDGGEVGVLWVGGGVLWLRRRGKGGGFFNVGVGAYGDGALQWPGGCLM